MPTNTLIITKGHPYERGPFFALLDAVFTAAGLGEYTHVEHPAAQTLIEAGALSEYPAVLFYDMPGIGFRAEPGVVPDYAAPSEAFKRGIASATEAGTGLLFLHHAIAGWPSWPEYAELIGGRFCYTPQRLRGRPVPDSGYRHDVRHAISVVADHPVTRGVPERFEITDELYLYQVFEDSVTPLLMSDHEFTDAGFFSAAAAVVDGKLFNNDGWTHPPGSALIGWTRQAAASRVVYLQCGDAPVAYESPELRQLLGNALGWVAQPAAGGDDRG